MAFNGGWLFNKAITIDYIIKKLPSTNLNQINCYIFNKQKLDHHSNIQSYTMPNVRAFQNDDTKTLQIMWIYKNYFHLIPQLQEYFPSCVTFWINLSNQVNV